MEKRARTKSKGLESEFPPHFPKGLAKNPADPSKTEDLFALQDANNGGETGFF